MNLLSRFALLSGMVLSCHSLSAADFYLAPTGADANSGTREQPFATMEAALDAARKAGAGPNCIRLLAGDYFLTKTVQLDARDAGLVIEAAEPGKAMLYGGRRVTEWRRDGETFWCADLPGVKEGTWDFRALVVNGKMPSRARMPATETFEHQNIFGVRWLSTVGGGWERKPTQEECTTLRYDPKALPATLDVRNAEVRVYHMWDDSLVGVASNDLARHTLVFCQATGHPPGAFGVKKYVVFNTREGMTQPGQWYLDRAAGRLVYWPLAGEDMSRADVVAPSLERLIDITGAERVTLRGLVFQATTTPLKPGGFGAGNYDGAIQLMKARACVLENLEICNVGGQAIKSWDLDDCRFTGCHIHQIGACGIRIGGKASSIVSNHIHHVGVYQPSAVALQLSRSDRDANTKGFHVWRNEIHDTPYSGIIVGGSGHLLEENLIYRVMRELHDGAAIYGSMLKHSVLRSNVVRDVVEVGSGYGASAYYLDEGSADCIIERNVAVGVDMPTHNHITRNLVIRDNVFFSDRDMKLSFQRSCDCAFTGNTLFAPGKITVSPPNAVTAWTHTVLFSGGASQGGVPQAFAITDTMPSAPPPGRRTAPFVVVRVVTPPVLDGEIGSDEWLGTVQSIDRLPSRWLASGAPMFAKFAYDDQCLYVTLNAVLFDITQLSKGGVWGRDDGAEVCVAGPAGTYVLRGFADGTLQSVTDAGVPAKAAARLGLTARFAAHPYGKVKNDWKSGWRGEWAIPFEALGLKAASGLKLSFNLGVYRAEDQLWRCLEGTQAENWRLDQAALLQLQ